MALVTDKGKTTNAFASSWLERLRQIKRIRKRVQNANHGVNERSEPFDFTNYTWLIFIGINFLSH